MRNLFFAVLFIAAVFFGFRYVNSWLTEPISEVNMTHEEEIQYLEELNEISGEGLHDTIMTTLKQCVEMAHAYESYTCLGTMITDESFIPSTDMDDTEKGETLYNLLGNQKPIIEMNYKRSGQSTDATSFYEVTLMLLQESERPVYVVQVEDTEIVKITKGEA